jgi:hypothetical protein
LQLKSIAPPPEPVSQPDLSKLTEQEVDELARLLSKMEGKGCGAAEIEARRRICHLPG